MLFPLLLPLPVIPAAPDSYWTVLFTAAAAGVAFYRAGAVFSAEFLLKRHSGAFRRAAPYLTAALFLIAVLWGYYLQRRAYDSMFLYFSDWGAICGKLFCGSPSPKTAVSPISSPSRGTGIPPSIC